MELENFNKKIWSELNEIRGALNKLTMEQIKHYVENNKEDVENLKKNFLETFEDVPNDDELRLEYLITLGHMGIIIYK